MERYSTEPDYTEKVPSVATTPTIYSNDDYQRLQECFAGGDISKASKAELERFAVMLSRPHAFNKFGTKDFPQVCETVRTLLIVRMSEQANEEALCANISGTLRLSSIRVAGGEEYPS